MQNRTAKFEHREADQHSRPYESVSTLYLTCANAQCRQVWSWPWPKYSKKPSRPMHCPDCREREIAVLGSLLERRIQSLRPDPRERCCGRSR
jgi:hypothetical protein